LLAGGINDSIENLGKLKDFCQRLAPDRVDVVTLTRPGTVKGVRPVEGEVISRWRKVLSVGNTRDDDRKVTEKEHLSMEKATSFVKASLARRPQTVLQLAQALNTEPEMISQAVEALEKKGDIIARKDGHKTFYHGSDHIIE
jgi:wyosine [tRNA(Phe)-imidazoG37] synthetase (radical SAM superfamily)